MLAKLIYKWVNKIHMYSGLLTFPAFIVWGVTGIHAVFLPPAGGYTPPEISSVREVPYQAAGDLDDKQLARKIYEAIKVPMAGGHYGIHRDDQLNLAFKVFTVNGGREVTFLEDQETVRIDHRRNNLWSYLSSMHTAHSGRHQLSVPAQAWGYFNELSTWAFLFMTISGVYMWVATRPGIRWAQASLGGMAALTLVLWILIR